jgi:hypothetical protein
LSLDISFFNISTFHSITIVLVIFISFSTKNIVHLTAALESFVLISNFESVFNFVALVHILPASRPNFTIVFKLSFHLKFSSFRVSTVCLIGSHKIDTLPSEKYISNSCQAGTVIVSHCLYIFQFSSVAININSSGLYGKFFSDQLNTKFDQLYSLIRLYGQFSAL